MSTACKLQNCTWLVVPPRTGVLPLGHAAVPARRQPAVNQQNKQKHPKKGGTRTARQRAGRRHRVECRAKGIASVKVDLVAVVAYFAGIQHTISTQGKSARR